MARFKNLWSKTAIQTLPTSKLCPPPHPLQAPQTVSQTRSPAQNYTPAQRQEEEEVTRRIQRRSGESGIAQRSWRQRLGWLGLGMRRDIKARVPYYLSDWTDAWNYRVVPATCVRPAPMPYRAPRLLTYQFIFFANILPGLAFSLDLIVRVTCICESVKLTLK
jgi:hypothetical protein